MPTSRPLVTTLITVAALALVASACGSNGTTAVSGPTTGATRTVQITMQDDHYVPASVSVAAGETVRFVFTNDGTATHDAFLGDEAAQADHENEMTGSNGVGGHGMSGHDMGTKDALTIAPGKTGELTHTFRAGDRVLIGCHQTGHYASGMKLAITVT